MGIIPKMRQNETKEKKKKTKMSSEKFGAD